MLSKKMQKITIMQKNCSWLSRIQIVSHKIMEYIYIYIYIYIKRKAQSSDGYRVFSRAEADFQKKITKKFCQPFFGQPN